MVFMKKATFVSRITIIFVITLVTAMASYSFIVAWYTYKIANEQLDNLTQTLSENISNNTDLVLKTMERISIVLLNSPDVRDTLAILQDDSSSFVDQRVAAEELQIASYMETTTRDFFYISYYGRDGELLYSTAELENDDKNLFATSDIKEGEIFREKILSPSNLSFEFYESDNPIAVVRTFLNPSNASISGYIVIFSDAKRLWQNDSSNAISSAGVPIKYTQTLLDENNKTILSTQEVASDSVLSQSKWKSSYSNWSVSVGTPRNDYFRLMLRSRIIGLLIPLLIIIVLTIILMRVLKKNLYPINTIVKSMESVSSGDYSARINESTGLSDIDVVFSGFNSMTSEIDQLINTVYANELLYHKVQLQMLKLQINPHFLYNTLQTIEAMGEINDVPEVSEISHLLGKILRYNLKERDLVTLGEEVESVNDFLLIQKIRFQSQLNFSLSISEDTLKLNVPKFILQPIVENSIGHGELIEKGNGLIKITSHIDGDKLVIEICDNGNGIKSDKLNALNKCLVENPDNSQSTDHIGLLNVNRRIITRFNKNYGIKIKSEENMFTKVIYVLPLLKEAPKNV
jgi:sensor histidine kinase YesM